MAVDKTMHLSLQDMLTNYFKQYHFNKMPENVRAKFDEHVEKNDLIGHMKDWKANLWVKDGKKEPADTLQNITSDDLIELYKDTRARLQQLNQQRALGKGDALDPGHPATKFLDEYFGEGNMFHDSRLGEEVKTTITKLLKSDDKVVKTALNAGLSAIKKSANNPNPKYTLEELEEKVKKEAYNTEPEFRKDLQQILDATRRELPYNSFTSDNYSDIRYELSELVSNGFDPNPTNSEIEDFKDELPFILNRVYSQKKLRETLFANSEITNAFNTARDEVDYDKKDSECFVEGKTDDELTFWQRLKKDVTDKYEDYFEKYMNGGYDHLYKSREAREIMGAIKKVGIKKTDGLDKILEKAADIKAKAVGKMKKAGPHMEWIEKEFTKLKKDMPEAFKGCLNNGFQLSRIIQQIIMDAVENDKMDEAKTTMELLVVMQYGNTTSGLMEKIRGDKELFSLFSNKDLSWNKNEGIAMVTKALDATIRVGGLAVGYGLTFIYNNVRQLGSRISEKDGNKFFKSAQDHWANHDQAREEKQAALGRADKRVQKYEEQLGLDERTKADLEASGKSVEEFLKENEDKLVAERDSIKFLDNDHIYKILDTIENRLETRYVDDGIDYDTTSIGLDYIKVLRENLKEDVPVKDLPAVPKELLANPKAKIYFSSLQNLFAKDNQKHDEFSEKQQKINKFKEATDELRSAEAQQAKYQKQLEEMGDGQKNKFDELVKYWNTLISDSRMFGRQSNMFGSKKAAQEAYWKELAAPTSGR